MLGSVRATFSLGRDRRSSSGSGALRTGVGHIGQEFLHYWCDSADMKL